MMFQQQRPKALFLWLWWKSVLGLLMWLIIQLMYRLIKAYTTVKYSKDHMHELIWSKSDSMTGFRQKPLHAARADLHDTRSLKLFQLTHLSNKAKTRWHMIKGRVFLRSLFCLSDFKAFKHLTLFCFTKKKKRGHFAPWLLPATDMRVKPGKRERFLIIPQTRTLVFLCLSVSPVHFEQVTAEWVSVDFPASPLISLELTSQCLFLLSAKYARMHRLQENTFHTAISQLTFSFLISARLLPWKRACKPI